ncbi:hypothetical protein ACS0TY_009973 [Phlomoides rotata]
MSAPRFRQLVPWKLPQFQILFLLMGLITHMVVSQSVVKSLPGFRGKLPFTLETGYIGVGESEELQIFYYFIESERNPEKDPLLLWLTGGPGCTGFSSLVYEIGPINFDYANSGGTIPTLVSNPYSWTKVANIIFIDQPAGTGFSYAKTPEVYISSDSLAGMTIYEFLKKWLINHPKYLDTPLYIGGGSYSGIFVPLVLDQIYKGIEAGSKLHLNIKGYILGNPITDDFVDHNGRIPYAHRMGLLSDELYLTAKENCKGNYLSVDLDNYLCKGDLERVNQCLDKISSSHILEPSCDKLSIERRGMLQHHLSSLYEDSGSRFLQSVPLRAKSWCRDMNMAYSYKWANIKLVQEALHVREGTLTEWLRCNSTLKGDYVFDVKSTVDYHKNFTHKDIRALIYSGDHDMLAPHTATEEWIRSMKLQIKSYWRPWFVEGQTAGYTTTYLEDDYELTYATVKGAGHTPSEYKPLECLSMIERWLSHNLL